VDEKTPPDADQCEKLIEATPDLHRLCVAYCKPQNSHLAGLENSDAARQYGDEQILKSYRKKMQPGDPDMPCVRQSCPCWTKLELHTAFPVGTRCSDHEGPKRNVVRLRYRQPMSDVPMSSALSEQHLSQFKHFCLFRDRQSEPGISRTLQISETDFIGCAVSIRGFADGLDLECDDDSGYE
jgi:hypothetical protein